MCVLNILKKSYKLAVKGEQSNFLKWTKKLNRHLTK